MRLAALLLVALALALAGSGTAAPGLQVHVSGNHFVDGSGKTVRLLGVNRSSFEYACAQGWGMVNGPLDAASIAAMKAWRINAVRLPLNEACWLGLPSVKPAYRGAIYRRAVLGYIQRLHDAGLYVIVDLHWNAPGSKPALDQQPMADADHSPAFWKSVAGTLKGDPAVVFDLYNEPHDIGWKCWRDGCTAGGFKTAGMKQLVAAVRSTGARNAILLGGLNWANDLDGWLQWRPPDPAGQLAAAVHVYETNLCGGEACWDSVLGAVAAQVPVVTGEFGQGRCTHDFIDRYMTWADAHGVSYLAWAWMTWGCEKPGLITDWDGTPTGLGAGLHDHLAALP